MFYFCMWEGVELPDRSKGTAHLWISWAAHALLPHTWIKDSCCFWNKHTYCMYVTQHKFTQKSLGFLSWLSKMVSEMSSAINSWTDDSWLPFSSQSNFGGYTLWGNLNYLLTTIFLQERFPSSNGKEHCYCCSRSVEIFIFICNVYQIYISLSEAISCQICLLMRLLFISCTLSFLNTTLRKAIDQEQMQER